MLYKGGKIAMKKAIFTIALVLLVVLATKQIIIKNIHIVNITETQVTIEIGHNAYAYNVGEN